MRVHILYDVEGWAYHRRAVALQKYAPDDMEISIGASRQFQPSGTHGVLLQLVYGDLHRVRKMYGNGRRPYIVAGYNVGAGYRRERLEQLMHNADHVVFNNRDNWDHHNRPDNSSWISNGVDMNIFRSLGAVRDRRRRAISIGSEYHWKHNDDLKGCRILRSIRNDLHSKGVQCDWRIVCSDRKGQGRLSQAEMVRWYNDARVYVVASRCEGTPNPALEAAACGCVLVATRVGNMPELIEDGVNGFLVERNPEAICRAVIKACDCYAAMAPVMAKRIVAWDWSQRATEYYDLFRKLIKEGKEP